MADVEMSGEAPVLSDEEMGGPAREADDLKADIEFETEPAPAAEQTSSTAFESKIDSSLFNTTETDMVSASAPLEAVPLEESASSMEADLEPLAAPAPPTFTEDAVSAAPGLSTTLDEPVGGSVSSAPVPPSEVDVLPSAVPGDADALVENTQDPQPEPQQAEDAADFTQEQLDAEAFEPAPTTTAASVGSDAAPKQAEAEAEQIADDQVAAAEVEAQAEDPAEPEQPLPQDGHLDEAQAEDQAQQVAQEAEESHEQEQEPHEDEISSEEDHESLLSGGLDPDSTQPSALVELLSSVDMPSFLAPYLDPPQDARALAGEEAENELDAIRAPPVLLSYNGQNHWLFARLRDEPDPVASTSAGAGEGDHEDQAQAAFKSDASAHPLLFDDDHGLYYETLDKLFDHLHDYFPAFHDEQMEIRLCVQELGIEIPEDNVYARNMTLHDLDRVFIGCDLPGRLTLTLTEAPRFIYRFNQLARHVAKFSSVKPEEHEHYEGEDEVVLPEEAESAVDEEAEDAEGEIDEGDFGPEAGKYDDAEADAPGEPEPLPVDERKATEGPVQQDAAEPQDQEEAAAPTEAGHVEESALAEAGVDARALAPSSKDNHDEEGTSNEARTPTVVGDETNGANGDPALSTDGDANGDSDPTIVAPTESIAVPAGDKSASVVSPKRSRDDDEADNAAESNEPNHESKRARAS